MIEIHWEDVRKLVQNIDKLAEKYKKPGFFSESDKARSLREFLRLHQNENNKEFLSEADRITLLNALSVNIRKAQIDSDSQKLQKEFYETFFPENIRTLFEDLKYSRALKVMGRIGLYSWNNLQALSLRENRIQFLQSQNLGFNFQDINIALELMGARLSQRYGSIFDEYKKELFAALVYYPECVNAGDFLLMLNDKGLLGSTFPATKLQQVLSDLRLFSNNLENVTPDIRKEIQDAINSTKKQEFKTMNYEKANSTLEEATSILHKIQKEKDKAPIKRNAMLLTQIAKQPGSKFYGLPSDLIAAISVYTQQDQKLSAKEAAEAAYEGIGKVKK